MLLILAGISIATLTGENGILSKATRAKNKNTEAQLKEQIKLAIMASRINSTLGIDVNELEGELLKIDSITNENIEKLGNEGALPWIITAENYQYEILEDGTVELVNNEIILSQTQIKLPIGGTDTLKVKIMGGKEGKIEWSCSDANVISIHEGSITAEKVGTSTVTATVLLGEEVCTAECNVSVVSIEEWIKQIVNNNHIENSNEYNTEKIKEEITKIKDFEEILELGQNGKFPWVVNVNDTGYNLNEDGSVSIINGLWVSNNNITIMQNQTYQLQVRYFDGDPSTIPQITPERSGWENFSIKYFSYHSIK